MTASLVIIQVHWLYHDDHLSVNNSYFPDGNASWYHISSSGTFQVDLHCVGSDDPTAAPTDSPTPFPTGEPTISPTKPADLCCDCGVATSGTGCDADGDCEGILHSVCESPLF